MFDHGTTPIGSIYGIYANIWGILMVNDTIYSIHGTYGTWHISITESFSERNHVVSLHQWYLS